MLAVVIKRVGRHLRGIREQTLGNYIRRPALKAVQLWTAISSQHDLSAASAGVLCSLSIIQPSWFFRHVHCVWYTFVSNIQCL